MQTSLRTLSLRADERRLLVEIVSARAPALIEVIPADSASLSLTLAQLDQLRGVCEDELMASGIDTNDQVNAHGLALLRLIDACSSARNQRPEPPPSAAMFVVMIVLSLALATACIAVTVMTPDWKTSLITGFAALCCAGYSAQIRQQRKGVRHSSTIDAPNGTNGPV